MDNRKQWVLSRIRLGIFSLVVGLLVIFVGIWLELALSYLPYDARIITGLGILLAGLGIGLLVRYGAALRDNQAALRLSVEERDERTVQIRQRAGNRAYWVSTALVYLGLMWASFASNGALPDLVGDALWYFLAAGVLIPFGVYIASILLDERNS